MNVLVIGSGGREHTLTWKISQSSRCDNVYIAPGNAGTASIGTNIPISVNDFNAISESILRYNISLLVIGPEDPLVNGLRDFLQSKTAFQDLMIIGPDAAGAQLEGSKDFSKKFMQENGIPAAGSKTFTVAELEQANTYIDEHSTPIVIKADGLAAGKGVIIADTRDEAKVAVRSMLVENKFAEAGQKVLIEEFLVGIELSVFVLTDGKNYKILPEAKDYKRIGENDTGLNTGGMGAVSPVPFASEKFINKVEENIIKPTLTGFNNLGINFVGFIFIGLMKVDNDPYVIEYNVRLGDPETQVVIPRITGDLLELFEATALGKIDQIELVVNPKTATTVVGVAGGYPEDYSKNRIIDGLDQNFEALVFQAGTKEVNNTIVTNGGRVIAVTGIADNLDSALNKSYSTLEKIQWQDMYYRRDIGQDLIQLTKSS